MLSNKSVISLQQVMNEDGLHLNQEETRSLGELLVSIGLQLKMSIKNNNEYENKNTKRS